MYRCFTILINPRGVLPNDEIETALALHGDWLRFAKNSYFALNELDAPTIRAIVREHLQPTADIIVILASLEEYSGWLSTVAKEWIQTNGEFLKNQQGPTPPAILPGKM